MSEKKYSLQIDNKIVEFTKGQTILEVAKNIGIYIPTLCYIEELPPYGGCRLCIVKVDGMKGYPTACTTPAIDGMKIITKDDEIQELRREILKLILSEHPHSCIVCDKKEDCEKIRKGVSKFGRMFGCFSCANKDNCELRRLAEYLEISDIQYPMEYQNFPIKRDDPFFEKDYNLCILCGKCVRICHELRGIGALNFINRGHDTQISTEFDLLNINTDCQFCGACVDICPTGALSSKNTKWSIEFDTLKTSICGFCSIGCGFDYYCYNGTLIESRPNKENIVNKGQACVIGRFCSPQFNNGRNRLKYPSIKQDNILIPSQWEKAYELISQKLKKYKPEEIAIIASPNLSNESAYLLNKFAKNILKTDNISLTFNETSIEIYYKFLLDNFKANYIPRSFEEIENANLILIVNSVFQFSHPILNINLRKAKMNGAKIISINLPDIKLLLAIKGILDHELYLTREEIIEFFVKISKEYIKNIENDYEHINNIENYKNWIQSNKINNINADLEDLCNEIINLIKNIKDFKGLIILNLSRNFSYDYLENIIGSLFNLEILSKNKFNIIPLWNRGNCEGVFQNLSFNNVKSIVDIKNDIRNQKIKALYTTERIEELDLLKNIECLILQDIYPSNNFEFAEVILPASTFFEDNGTFLNSELRLQSFVKSTLNIGNSKPDWQIISELAIVYDESKEKSFLYSNPNEILEEIKLKNPYFKSDSSSIFKNKKNLFKPDLEITYSEPLEDPYWLKSFKYRGEAIYNQVEDLKELIDYRSLERKEVVEDSEQEKIGDSPFKVRSNKEIVPNIFKLVIEAPLIAKKANPGNFIIMMKDEESERIPMTLADWDADDGTITIFYQETGFSTRELTYVEKNDIIFSIVGPLGKEFPIKNYGTVLLGGGCYGIAAIYPIAKALKANGNYIIVLLEARNKILFYLEKEIESIADEVIYCTSDGSKGIKGKIDKCLNNYLNQGKQINRFHFVGCNIMMMEASNITKSHGLGSTTVSLRNIMIDGTGMCGGCRLTLIKDGKEITKFACVDGPIFDAHMINWQELLQRGQQFDHHETQIYQTHSCKVSQLLKQEDLNE